MAITYIATITKVYYDVYVLKQAKATVNSTTTCHLLKNIFCLCVKGMAKHTFNEIAALFCIYIENAMCIACQI